MPGPSMPSIPTHTFNSPGMSMGSGEKVCGNCHKVLPASFTAGDTCPGCGVHFDVDTTNGKTSHQGIFGGGGGGGGGGPSRGVIRGIIVLVVLGIKAMAYMAWRSQQS
jgi:hypothetical protein